MKLLMIMAIVVSPLLASCAHPLERVVDQQRQSQIEAAYADKPVAYGGGDGLGTSIAQSEVRLTLSDRPLAH
jgi:hypothetical protein